MSAARPVWALWTARAAESRSAALLLRTRRRADSAAALAFWRTGAIRLEALSRAAAVAARRLPTRRCADALASWAAHTAMLRAVHQSRARLAFATACRSPVAWQRRRRAPDLSVRRLPQALASLAAWRGLAANHRRSQHRARRARSHARGARLATAFALWFGAARAAGEEGAGVRGRRVRGARESGRLREAYDASRRRQQRSAEVESLVAHLMACRAHKLKELPRTTPPRLQPSSR